MCGVDGDMGADVAIVAVRAVLVSICYDLASDRVERGGGDLRLFMKPAGFATVKDINMTCNLGSDYLHHPLDQIERVGFVHHDDVRRAAFENYGAAGDAPAIAKAREGRE